MGQLAAGVRRTARESRHVQSVKAKQALIELVMKGMSIPDGLLEIGRHRSTYERWRSEDPDFAAQMDNVRAGIKSGKRGLPPFPDFCAEFLGQPMSWHQMQWVDLLEGRKPRNLHPSEIFEPGDPSYLLINTPPEHAKTTTLSINYPTYRIIAEPNIKIIAVSKTQERAKEFIFAIKSRLTHPKFSKLQMAFGPAGGWKADAAVWSADRVYLGSERDSGEKDPTIQAVGIGGQIYGARADLILVDDAVVLSNAHEFEKQIRWLQQEVITRIGPHGRILVVGTRVDAVDLYRELRDPARYPSGESPWTYLAQPAVLQYADKPEDWVTLWPKAPAPWPGAADKPDKAGLFPRWDGKNLSRRRGLLAPRTWALAYMQADVEEDAIFDANAVRACVNGMRAPGRLNANAPGHRDRGMEGLYVIGSMDPAMVGDTGVVVYGVDRFAKKRYVLDARLRGGATPAWIREVIKDCTGTYGIHEWRIEKNAFQQFLTQDPELNEWLASVGVRLSEHHTGKNKWDAGFGVASMAGLFTMGLIELPSTSKSEPVKQLVEQLITWSPETKAKTDMVMALWFAEIRAREICQAASLDGGQQLYVPNRFLTRRARRQQVVMNLNDMALANRMG